MCVVYSSTQLSQRKAAATKTFPCHGLLSVSASFSRNTMDFPCIFFGMGKFYFYSFIFSWQIAISALVLYTVDLYLSYVMSSLC
jgi:hypothetical protein